MEAAPSAAAERDCGFASSTAWRVQRSTRARPARPDAPTVDADKHIIVYTPREGHDWESVSSRRDVQVTTMSNNADTTDLAWSPDCVRLAVGGVDASVTIWDSGKREPMFVRKDHRSFVQGVAWDPAEELLASLSSDRSLALVRVPAVFGKPDAQGRRRRRRSAATVVPQRECPLIKSVSAPQLEDQGSGERAAGSAASTTPAAPAPSSSSSSSSSAGAAGPSPSKAAAKAAAASGAAAPAPKTRPATRSLWLPESTPTFFRRPAFSPDGSLLVCPTGQARFDRAPGAPAASVLTPGSAGAGTTLPVTHVFRRGHWQSPLLHLPHHGKASVAAAFAPRLFCTDATPLAQAAAPAGAEAPAESEPAAAAAAAATSSAATAAATVAASTPAAAPAHAMLLAVATMDGVVVYDTAAGRALATAAHIHMERITDVSWAHDSALVAVASMDGYVSLLAMDPEEVGRAVPKSILPKRFLDAQPAAQAPGAKGAPVPAVSTLQPRKQTAAAAGSAEPAAAVSQPSPGRGGPAAAGTAASAVNVLQPRKKAPAAPPAAAVNVLQPRKKASPAAAAPAAAPAAGAAEPAAAVNVLQPRKKAPAAPPAAAVNVLQPRKKAAPAPKRDREEGSDQPASAPAARKPKRATLVPVVPRAGVTGPDE